MTRVSLLKDIIEKNPGIQFRELMRHSGLKNGVLSHYINKLEKENIIKVVRGPRQIRFYVPAITEEESLVIKALRKPTQRIILFELMYKQGQEFSQLVKTVKKSPSTVSFYMTQLVSDNIVYTKRIEFKKRYYIKSRDLVSRLVEEYRPSLLAKSSAGFEDIINSL